MPENLPAWAQWLTSGGVGAVLMKGADVLMNRESRQVKTLGETIEILADQQEQFKRDLKACHEHHEACEENRRRDREEHTRELAAVEKRVGDQIARLLAGDVPNYKPEDLKRVGRRAGS